MLGTEDAEIEAAENCSQGGYSLVKEPTVLLTMVLSSPEKGHETQPGGPPRRFGGAEALMAAMSEKNRGGTEGIPGTTGNMNEVWRNSRVQL